MIVLARLFPKQPQHIALTSAMAPTASRWPSKGPRRLPLAESSAPQAGDGEKNRVVKFSFWVVDFFHHQFWWLVVADFVVKFGGDKFIHHSGWCFSSGRCGVFG